MQRSCAQCRQSFEITEGDLAFYEKISPIFNGRKETIPPPTLCPDCRSRRRMAWRNERTLYNRLCGLCKRSRISAYAPDSPMVTYCQGCFFGDAWDPKTYGRDYDFSKPFFGNLAELLREAPVMMLYQSGVNENCDYTNFFGPASRNCYLIFNSGRDEDCYFSRGLVDSKDCADIMIGSNDELCYECINCSTCYRTLYSQNCSQCTESAFLFNCRRCKNCFGCTNLVEKEFYVFNKPCDPDQFNALMGRLASAKFVSESAAQFDLLKRQSIHRATGNISTENSTGDFLTDCKNCTNCYEVKGAEDCAYLLCSKFTKDSHDLFGFGYDSELLYDSIAVGHSTSTAFSFTTEETHDSYYCLYCKHVSHCFGCVGLRHASYCILNKQYSQEEYEALVPKIIANMRSAGEWGEFFPAVLSPFGYNETVGQDYLPFTEDEAARHGFRWHPPADTATTPEGAPDSAPLPDEITSVSDDILKRTMRCEISGKPYRITHQELEFYRKMGVPLPHLHPDERHRQRMRRRNPCRIWTRPCMKCSKAMRTTYDPGRPETVYCEECYLATVY